MKLVEIINEEPKSQEDWTNWHNANGSIMASAADLYLLGKQKQSIKKDTETSTKIFYHGRQNVRIIHNCGSRFSPPIESRVVRMPSSDLDLTKLTEKNFPKEYFDFFQALFNTNDMPEQILETIKILSNNNPRALNMPAQVGSGYTKVSFLINSANYFFIKCCFLTFGNGTSYKVVK